MVQDSNKRELAALVHRNPLIKANLSMADELKDLWAPPKANDKLRRRNCNLELIPSYAQNIDIFDQYLQDDNEVELEEMDLEVNGPTVGKSPKRKHQIFEEIVVEPMSKRRSKIKKSNGASWLCWIIRVPL